MVDSKKIRFKIYYSQILIIALLLFNSCKQPKTYIQKDKNEFISGCLKANRGKVSETKAKALCNCMLEKVMKKNIPITESHKMKIEEIREIALECISQNQKKK